MGVFISFWLLIKSSANSKSRAKKKNFDEIATLSGVKSRNELVSIILKIVMSNYLESNSFGEMSDFSIDTNNKSFAFSLNLKGETAPLRVAVSKYELQKENGKFFFVAKEIITVNELVNQVAKYYLQEKKIEIPSKYSLFLQLVS